VDFLFKSSIKIAVYRMQVEPYLLED